MLNEVDSTKYKQAQMNHQCGRSRSHLVVQITPRVMCPPLHSFAIDTNCRKHRGAPDGVQCCKRNRVATINQIGRHQSKTNANKFNKRKHYDLLINKPYRPIALERLQHKRRPLYLSQKSLLEKSDAIGL